MKIQDLKQIRKKLEKEYNENCLKINDLDKKIEVMNAYDFEKRAGFALIFSVVSLLVNILIIGIIPDFSFIPKTLITPLSFLTNTLVGITIEEILVRKTNLRERFKEFSKSKKQKEKLED